MLKLFLLLSLSITFTLNAQNITNHVLKPTGVFKEINISNDYKANQALFGNNKKLKQQTMESILKNPNNYNPTVLYAISRELYNQDKKDSATYWFYLGQLRARYDANLCKDNSAKQAVAVLNQEYGPDINKYAFENLDTLKSIVSKVVDFVRINDEKYDHRWINLHGMAAMRSSLGDDDAKTEPLSEPKNKWAEIKEKTLNEYYSDFLQAFARFKKMKK